MGQGYLMPQRRKLPRSGISRGPRREWPRHRAFLRRHHCVVSGCIAEPTEVAHIRTADNAGIGLKPHDGFAVSMCHGHHLEYHRDGHHTFERRHRLNLNAIAAEFVRHSPDLDMRESLAQRCRPEP
jgi:hypothetical protein